MGTFEINQDGHTTYLDEVGRKEVVTYAVAVDAGDNELERVAACDWLVLTTKYARAIREGRITVVGV